MSRRITSHSLLIQRSHSESKRTSHSKLISSEYLQSNSLRIPDFDSTSQPDFKGINSSNMELQAHFVLVAAEVERLLILNSVLCKEAELWKRKYKECDTLLEQKTAKEIVKYLL